MGLARLRLDLTHTAHTAAATGVQQVARRLRAALRCQLAVEEVVWDRWAGCWRAPDRRERMLLEEDPDRPAASARGSRWTLAQRWRGRLSRWRGRGPEVAPAGVACGSLCPELFTPTVGRALPHLWAVTAGPRAAIFHDALALRWPHLAAPATVARFPSYLKELSAFDGVAAVSRWSAEQLQSYWDWLGLSRRPPVVAIPLGVPPRPVPATDPAGSRGGDATAPVFLCVGTLEPRKNHPALWAAAESCWAAGDRFRLLVVGSAPSSGREIRHGLEVLQARGRDLVWTGPVSERSLDRLYEACDATIYPSLAEGFGLPVWESIRHGKPCLCGQGGALAESALGGGCLALPRVDGPALAEGLRQLLDPQRRATFAEAARRRPLRTWDRVAEDLRNWLAELPPRVPA